MGEQAAGEVEDLTVADGAFLDEQGNDLELEQWRRTLTPAERARSRQNMVDFAAEVRAGALRAKRG